MEEKIYHVPLVWSMMAIMDIPATSLKEAIEKADDYTNEVGLPTNGEYLEDSLEVDHDGDVHEIMSCYNEEHAEELIFHDYEHWKAAVGHGIIVTTNLITDKGGIMVSDAITKDILCVCPDISTKDAYGLPFAIIDRYRGRLSLTFRGNVIDEIYYGV